MTLKVLALDTTPQDLFPMTVDMPLFVNIRPDILSNKTKRFKASLGRHLRARFLQVLRSAMPMRAKESAEMQLQVEMRGHGVGTMDFGSPGKVAVPTFVSAEKLGTRKGSPDFAHAFHVEGALDKCKVPMKWQHKAACNTGVLGIKVMTSILSKLSGLLSFGNQRGGSWPSKIRFAPFRRKVGGNGNMVPEDVLSGDHLLKESIH